MSLKSSSEGAWPAYTSCYTLNNESRGIHSTKWKGSGMRSASSLRARPSSKLPHGSLHNWKSLFQPTFSSTVCLKGDDSTTSSAKSLSIQMLSYESEARILHNQGESRIRLSKFWILKWKFTEIPFLSRGTYIAKIEFPPTRYSWPFLLQPRRKHPAQGCLQHVASSALEAPVNLVSGCITFLSKRLAADRRPSLLRLV